MKCLGYKFAVIVLTVSACVESAGAADYRKLFQDALAELLGQRGGLGAPFFKSLAGFFQLLFRIDQLPLQSHHLLCVRLNA